MTIPTYQGTVGALRAARACIIAETPAVLSAAASGLSLTLPVFATVYSGEMQPPNIVLPACGVFIPTSGMMVPSVNDAYDMQHTMVCDITIEGGGPDSPTITDFEETAQAYAQAVSYAFSAKFATPGESYGLPVGCYTCDVVESYSMEPQPTEQSGRFRRTVRTTLTIMQRMPRI